MTMDCRGSPLSFLFKLAARQLQSSVDTYISNFKSQISSLKFQVSNFKSQISIINYTLSIIHYQLYIINYQFKFRMFLIKNFQLLICQELERSTFGRLTLQELENFLLMVMNQQESKEGFCFAKTFLQFLIIQCLPALKNS